MGIRAVYLQGHEREPQLSSNSDCVFFFSYPSGSHLSALTYLRKGAPSYHPHIPKVFSHGAVFMCMLALSSKAGMEEFSFYFCPSLLSLSSSFSLVLLFESLIPILSHCSQSLD